MSVSHAVQFRFESSLCDASYASWVGSACYARLAPSGFQGGFPQNTPERQITY